MRRVFSSLLMFLLVFASGRPLGAQDAAPAPDESSAVISDGSSVQGKPVGPQSPGVSSQTELGEEVESVEKASQADVPSPSADDASPKPSAWQETRAVVRGDAGSINTGQDFTRPVAKVEYAYTYLDMAGDTWAQSLTVRAGIPITLPRGWTLSVRCELPYSVIDGPSRNNPLGSRIKGFGEFVGEALAIAPTKERWTYALGAQWIPPSASHDELGTGRHQLVPSAGVRYDLGGWMQGAWCGAMLRHAFDVAGYEGYPHISQSIVQPMLHMDLPGRWFLTFAPEIRYDWKNSDWFVPFDITSGRMVSDTFVAALTYRSAVNDDMMLYVNTFELRITYLLDIPALTLPELHAPEEIP